MKRRGFLRWFAPVLLVLLGACGEPPEMKTGEAPIPATTPAAAENVATPEPKQESAPPHGAPQATPQTQNTTQTVAQAAPAPVAAPEFDRSVLPADAPSDAEIVPTIKEAGVRGGQLVIPITGDPKTFNTLLVEGVSDQFIDTLQIAPLYNYDWQLQKDIPGLAKSWEYNEQTSEWTFHLREGLKWSDGQPLTADDFLFFTELAFDPGIPNDFNLNFRLEPSNSSPKYEFRAPDPHTLVVRIPGPDSFSWINLGQMRAFPRHALEKVWKAGQFNTVWGQNVSPGELVVSGPFKLKEFRPGERVVFERNPQYWRYDAKGQQLPYLDRLVLTVVKDLEAQELRFLAGDLDLLDATQGGFGIKPDNLANFMDRAQAGEFEIFRLGPGFDVTYFSFNTNLGGTYATGVKNERKQWQPTRRGEKPTPDLKDFKPFVDPVKLAWFSNPEFRIACSELTNRKRIIDSVLFGQAGELYNIIAAGDKEWCNPKIKTFPYNPDSAKKRLDKIGFIDRNGDGLREDPQGNTIRFTMETNRENNIREKAIQILKEDFRAAGLDLQPQVLDFNTLVSKHTRTFDYEGYLMGLGSSVPLHPGLGTNVYPSSGRLHYGYSNQKTPVTEWETEIDALYGKMKLTFDKEEQRRLFNRIQEIFAEQQPAIHLFSTSVNVAARKHIGGLRPAILRGSLTHNIDELYIKK